MLIYYNYAHLHLFFNNTYLIQIYIFDILENIGIFIFYIDLIFKFLDFYTI